MGRNDIYLLFDSRQTGTDFKTAAGPIRNEKMAKYAAEVDRKMLIAFWDGQSKGTGSMIDLAKKHGIEVHVVNI